MKFQPGQSGNPAGRPPGALNKKTIAMQEIFAATADETAKMIVARAQSGNSTAMRLCVERTPPDVELPTVKCADDAQKALDTVIEAFGRGAITARELPSMVAAVDRMARLVQRIEEMRGEERERYKALRVHNVHPSILPTPTGEPDPVVVAMRAAGEEVPAYLAAASDANEHGHVRLYSPVNSGAESLPPRAQASEGEGGSPERSDGEPGGGIVQAADSDLANGPERGVLHFPVNSAADSPPPDAADGAAPSPASGGGISEPLHVNPG